MRRSPRYWRRRLLAIAASLLAVVGATAVDATPAHADDLLLTATYPLTGTTHIATTDSDLTLGPGTLLTDINLTTGVFTANVNLPPATGSFTELGIIPVQATTEFIEAQPTTGTLDINTGAVHSESHIILRLTSLKVAGIPMLVGDHCQTEAPATLELDSQPGFNVLFGGDLAGTYTIPDFEHCLLATPLINLTIPGPNNAITLTLGKPTFG